LIEQPAYSPADKARMIQLLVQLDIYRVTNGIVRRYRTPTPKWAWLRANRGTFDVEHTDTGIEIVATGRSSWVGWLELATEPVDETSTCMTAQVIHDVGILTTPRVEILSMRSNVDLPDPRRTENPRQRLGQTGKCSPDRWLLRAAGPRPARAGGGPSDGDCAGGQQSDPGQPAELGRRVGPAPPAAANHGAAVGNRCVQVAVAGRGWLGGELPAR